MAAQVFTDGQILTAAEMNALSTQAAGAAQTANNGSDFTNLAALLSNIGALPNTTAALQTLMVALFATLPTTLPGSSGQLWLNGGVLQRS